ncbi:hypothetical protein [Alkalimarinus sediminis]|uniref:Uncharacterized protein n=1 Tax=Alkalimarinus sediminis TaxID=1632866 RepID=A0A9E8HNT3_9ALTE|nr:hypothetical protein [Alkalimarinus sediminis]UZW76008.1 hypothetical protein NNL22_05345 [Alkalimarinus sediminis]
MRRLSGVIGVVNRCVSVSSTLLIVVTMFSVSAYADKNKQVSEFEGISVTGSNEQPQVLYIIPWQPPAYQKRAQHPPNKALTGVIKPIEPAFHNEDYHFRKKLQVKVQALNGRK